MSDTLARVRTVAQLLEGKGIEYPRTAGGNVTLRRAPKARRKKSQQHEFGLE